MDDGTKVFWNLVGIALIIFGLWAWHDGHDERYQTQYVSASAFAPRTGAICDDYAISPAIGAGACSYHGGVDTWTTSSSAVAFRPRWIEGDPKPWYDRQWTLLAMIGAGILITVSEVNGKREAAKQSAT